MFKRKEDEELLREAIRTPNYQYGKEQSTPLSDSRWKNESQYDEPVGTDFMGNMVSASGIGDYNKAGYNERVRNEKIGLGYGGKYSPTYMYNYNPSENRAMADDIRTKLMEYDKFDYDPQNDAAYKALASVYQRNAKAASENALARAAAANGGRLSSNAIIAANLGYQDKMAGLEAEIPALREAAYNMFRNEKNDLRQMAYDYDTLEAENYNRWVDDYNRRYTNTFDMLARQDAEKEREANKEALEYNRAYTMAQNLGYVTDALSTLTGIPAGTPFESAKQFMDNMKFNIQSEMGEFSTPYIESYGLDIPGGKTIGAKQLDITQQNNLMDYEVAKMSNAPYDPYGDDSGGDYSDNGGDVDIDDLANHINNNLSITPENIFDAVDEMIKMYGLSDEKAIELYNKVGL